MGSNIPGWIIEVTLNDIGKFTGIKPQLNTPAMHKLWAYFRVAPTMNYARYINNLHPRVILNDMGKKYRNPAASEYTNA